MEVGQRGIKNWQSCERCGWVGKALKRYNELTECPNCTNPTLLTQVDFKVNNGKRYDTDVRNPQERDEADAVRQNEGRGPAPQDTRDESRKGYQYE